MAKGWKTIYTNSIKSNKTKEDRVKLDHTFDNVMRKTKPKKTTFELKQEGEELFVKKVKREDSLLAAAADGKLQSQTLKKQATAIQKARDKKKEKNK